jgi:hypothetical protein
MEKKSHNEICTEAQAASKQNKSLISVVYHRLKEEWYTITRTPQFWEDLTYQYKGGKLVYSKYAAPIKPFEHKRCKGQSA